MTQPAKKALPKNTGKNTEGNNSEKIETDKVRFFVELMKENNLTELEIQQGTTKIRIKRGNEAAETVAVFTQPPIVSSASISSPAAVSVPAVQPPIQETKNTNIIKSPMVGTFYSAPNPQSPPFVKTGDIINADTTICLIEAMKVYNEIQAECTGKITAILAKNGSAVEFGSPLFEITVN